MLELVQIRDSPSVISAIRGANSSCARLSPVVFTVSVNYNHVLNDDLIAVLP